MTIPNGLLSLCYHDLVALIQLDISGPNIYSEFLNGKFSFQKTLGWFFTLAPDQVHEQNNGMAKGTVRATHFLKRQDKTGIEPSSNQV